MNIRKAVATDRPKIFELLKKIRLFTEEEIGVALEILDVYLGNPYQKDYDFFCCADAQETVRGYMGYGKVPLTDAVYDLYWIAVDTGAQNQGIGKALLAHLDDLLMARAARMLLAETSSKISYGKTRAFYARNGFTEISRIPDFYCESDDKIVFAKFYSLYERRIKNRWNALIESPADPGAMSRTRSGMIGTGKLETASEL